MKKGRAGTMTHDYKRNGTTTLFAALVAAKPESVTQIRARRGDWRMHAASSCQGVLEVPEANRADRPQAPRRACDLRQLQDP